MRPDVVTGSCILFWVLPHHRGQKTDGASFSSRQPPVCPHLQQKLLRSPQRGKLLESSSQFVLEYMKAIQPIKWLLYLRSSSAAYLDLKNNNIYLAERHECGFKSWQEILYIFPQMLDCSFNTYIKVSWTFLCSHKYLIS